MRQRVQGGLFEVDRGAGGSRDDPVDVAVVWPQFCVVSVALSQAPNKRVVSRRRLPSVCVQASSARGLQIVWKLDWLLFKSGRCLDRQSLIWGV